MTQEDQGDDSEEPASPDLEELEAEGAWVYFDKESTESWIKIDLAIYIDEEGNFAWRWRE